MDNKYFSVEEMNSLIENLELAFTDYGDKADTLISKCKEFQNDDSFTGERATVVKDLVGDNEVSLVNAQKDMQAKLLSMYKHAADSFAEKVDSAPNARLDLETLDMVESDLKAIYRDVDTTCAEIENIAKEMNAKYGHFGHITVPNADPLRESLENLCGGYNPEAGFYHDLKQKFINWDEEECAYIESQLLDDDIKDQNKKIENQNELFIELPNLIMNNRWNKFLDINYYKKILIVYNYLKRYGFTYQQIQELYSAHPQTMESLYSTLRWSEGDSLNVIKQIFRDDYADVVEVLQNKYGINEKSAEDYFYKAFLNNDMNNLIDAARGDDLCEISKIIRRSINDSKYNTYQYVQYNISLKKYVDLEYNLKNPIQVGPNDLSENTGKSSKENIEFFLDPNNLIDSDIYRYVFLDLSSSAGLTVEQLNSHLDGNGILAGKGMYYYEAAQKYGVNEAYLVGHSILETGKGTSELANGIDYITEDGNHVTVYNMYGIGALDGTAIESGAKYAYEMGWFTPEDAIYGGAEWISNNYFENNQKTLYEMRWNPNNPGLHQYASDVGWATKQALDIKNAMDEFPDASKVFLVPEYDG